MFGLKMGQDWLKGFFTNPEEDVERDVIRKIWVSFEKIGLKIEY